MLSSSVAECRRVFSAGPGESGRDLSPMEKLRLVLTVSRVELLPMSVGIMAAIVVLSVHTRAEVFSLRTIGTIVFVSVYFQCGNLVNAMADRWQDLDFKTRLAHAVRDLGIPRMNRLVLVHLIVMVLILAWLVVSTRHLDLVIWGGLLIIISFQYSLPPLHLKSTGIWHIVVIAMSLLILPGITLLRVHDRPFDWVSLIIVIGIAVAANSVSVVNSAEDIPEDTEHGINSFPRAIGLLPSLGVALAQLVIGAGIVVGVTFPVVGFSWVYIPYLAAVLMLGVYLIRMINGVQGKPLDEAVAVIRDAKVFSLAVVPLAWTSILPAAGFFASR
jgi:lycopene elongase/hydratase (dihydrobisanhydrobacterioruberin-forming)